jgi:hypothetical protein
MFVIVITKVMAVEIIPIWIPQFLKEFQNLLGNVASDVPSV